MEPQRFSHFPTWPMPVLQRAEITGPQLCSYLPGRSTSFRAFRAVQLSGEAYQKLMDAGFRRSGPMIYQPMCPRCRECVPLRVPVSAFTPSRSQRRVLRQNSDLLVEVAAPQPTREKWELYDTYQRQWHGKITGGEGDDVTDFLAFLYLSPVHTLEFSYRDRAGKLLAVGICDLCPHSLSSVYLYFDPREEKRSLGTFSALYEIQWAQQKGLIHWYAGYWIKDCPAMAYKSRFAPCELLGTDGVWRAHEE